MRGGSQKKQNASTRKQTRPPPSKRNHPLRLELVRGRILTDWCLYWEIGQVVGRKGSGGTLSISFLPDMEAFVRASGFFFIPVVKKPVPFRVVWLEILERGRAHLCLEGINSPQEAAPLCQQPLLAFKEELEKFYHRRKKPLSFAVGYTVLSREGMVVGKVEEVFFEGGKGFLVVATGRHPLIVSASGELPARIDHSRKRIRLSLSANQLDIITR